MGVLRKSKALPIRLLLIGLPMTILHGFGVGAFFFKNLSLFEVALLAVMLAPTDAALGKAAATKETVPDAGRQGLNMDQAFYYVRMLEISTPRWTAYDAKCYDITIGKEVPMTTQSAHILGQSDQVKTKGYGKSLFLIQMYLFSSYVPRS